MRNMGLSTAPVLGGPHGGKFNVSTTKRLIDQYVYDARKLPGPGQYNGTYEPIDVPLAGEHESLPPAAPPPTSI